MLDEAELGVVELRRHELPLAATEVEFDQARVPVALLEALEADPDARTYQFVAKAIPMAAGDREDRRRLRQQAEGAAEPGIWGGTAETETLREENLRLSVRLDRILASPPMRIYAALRGLPGMRVIQRRRSAGFEAELARRATRDA